MYYHMVEKNPKKTKTQSEYLFDNDSSEDKVSPHLHTYPEERLYSTVKGQRFGASDTSGIGSYYGTVQPHGRKRTTKTAKN